MLWVLDTNQSYLFMLYLDIFNTDFRQVFMSLNWTMLKISNQIEVSCCLTMVLDTISEKSHSIQKQVLLPFSSFSLANPSIYSKNIMHHLGYFVNGPKFIIVCRMYNFETYNIQYLFTKHPYQYLLMQFKA